MGEGGSPTHLLAWYDVAARALPWRTPPGIRPDPYAVWLSEIMLQQTTVKAVIPYYQKFLARWPRVGDLAAADLNEVLAAWAGLGYYSRARNLHACARAVVERHGGRFPHAEAELLALPGIGAYTAAAIASIAFDRQAAAVDGNVERVVARLFAVDRSASRRQAGDPAARGKPHPRKAPRRLHPSHDGSRRLDLLAALALLHGLPGLGALPGAGARADGNIPAKTPKKERPVRRGAAFVARRRDGAVLLRRRPPKGLLGGMLEVPSTPWTEELPARDVIHGAAPFAANWVPLAGRVSHTFTHFHLELEVYLAALLNAPAAPDGCAWYAPADLPREALPSLMRKVLAHAAEPRARQAQAEALFLAIQNADMRRTRRTIRQQMHWR